MAEVVCGGCDGVGDIPTEYAAAGPMRNREGDILIHSGKIGSLMVPIPCVWCNGSGWIQLYARKTKSH